MDYRQKSRNIFSQNLRKRISELGITQSDIAEHLDAYTSTVSGWFSGRSIPRSQTLNQLAAFLQTTPADLLLDPEEIMSDNLPYIKIPILANVSCGKLDFTEKNIKGYIEIPSHLAKSGEFFAVMAKGNSMLPEIKHRDILIVRKQPTANDNDLVIVVINNDEAVCKKYKRTKNGIGLIPLNQSGEYPNLFFTPKEIDSLPIIILGIVIEIRRKL